MNRRRPVIIDGIVHRVVLVENGMSSGQTACHLLFTLRGRAWPRTVKRATATYANIDCMTCIVKTDGGKR